MTPFLRNLSRMVILFFALIVWGTLFLPVALISSYSNILTAAYVFALLVTTLTALVTWGHHIDKFITASEKK